MKSPQKLQEKLLQLLEGMPALSVMPDSTCPWNESEFREVAGIVQNFVNQNTDVIEGDPLKDWLEEYSFYHVECKLRRERR